MNVMPPLLAVYQMNAWILVVTALVVFALAYRFYYSFIAAKVAVLNDQRVMPSKRFYDGQNYFPTSKWVLFGQHFAAIAGAGPLVGPVLAAQFGYAPGFLWMLIGCVMAGGVHDMIILVASVRHEGKSLAEIARSEISKVSGVTASFTIIVIIIVTLAGLGLAVVNALAHSSWGTFTIACTIPIAIFMGLWMFVFRKGHTVEATIVGVILLSLAVIYGRNVSQSSWAHFFEFDKPTLSILLACYGLCVSAMPVWLLLTPRGYLSAIMKLAVIAMLAGGVIIVAPTIQMPAFTSYTQGGGPVIPGPMFPYLFVTIACGAISGFHSLVSSGTTPKMIISESHIKSVAAGAMLAEGVVSILALIAATSLFPLDYFMINVDADKIGKALPALQQMGFVQSNLPELSREVNETIAGRPGGAVSLAVGMAQIFSSIPGLKSLMSYWYHFAIMFEALFILTLIDSGTRIARFIIQESAGKLWAPLGRTNWLPANLAASAVVVFAWGYFIYSGSVSTIWPMFGAANQLLATIALAIGTSFIINRGKVRYAWVTLIPLIFVGITTLTASYMNITTIYWPETLVGATRLTGWVDIIATAFIMVAAVAILVDSVPRWFKAVHSEPRVDKIDIDEKAEPAKVGCPTPETE